MDRLTRQIEEWIGLHELSGASLIIRRNDQKIYHRNFGWSDISKKTPLTDGSIFRMMSMSKIITAAGVMKLIEQGRLGLDDAVSDYIPSFRHPRVVQDDRYVYSPDMSKLRIAALIAGFRLDHVKTVPAEREITIRDLLSHSSGLEQGVVGFIASMKNHHTNETLSQEVEKYAAYPLDFQPGTATSYSPLAGFDTLLRVCEIISGKRAADYLKEVIFDPLGMTDTGFFLNEEQRSRLVHVYKKDGGALKDTTDTEEDMDGMLHRGPAMTSGAGGIYSSAVDYERFAHMLCNEGIVDGVRILNPDTIKMMHTEGAKKHMEPDPGTVWGLGVRIRQDPEKAGVNATAGTYGWSGAFGTHCFISPRDHLEAVWCTNRSDAGGSGFPISREIEKIIFQICLYCMDAPAQR